jgi:hypothetical protein
MKTLRRLIPLTLVVALIGVSAAIAAPVDSVESSRASAAFQKVDAFLAEQAVSDQLTKLGLTPDQAHARLARLSDAQLEQLAAEIDTLQAGGTVQGGNPSPTGPLACVFHQICQTIVHIFKAIFCFNDIT